MPKNSYCYCVVTPNVTLIVRQRVKGAPAEVGIISLMMPRPQGTLFQVTDPFLVFPFHLNSLSGVTAGILLNFERGQLGMPLEAPA